MNKEIEIPKGVRKHLDKEEVEYFYQLLTEHSSSFVDGLLKMTDEDMATAVKLFKEFETDMKNKNKGIKYNKEIVNICNHILKNTKYKPEFKANY